MRRRAAIAGATLALTFAIALAACGDDDGGSDTGGPQLAGTTIPTVAPTPTPKPDCTDPVSIGMPPNVPVDILTPETYIVTKVETTPHLHIEGLVRAPLDLVEEDIRRAAGVVAQAQLTSMVDDGWYPTYNDSAPGRDYTMTHPDGRVMHYAAINDQPCLPRVTLIYDFFYVTP